MLSRGSRHWQLGNHARTDTKLRVNLAAMQLLQIKKSIGFEFDHWLLLLWEGRLSQEEVSLQAMHTTLVGPLAHPGSNATYGFFSVWLGLNAILHFSDITPQAAAVGADISAFGSFYILMRLRCFGEALLSPSAWSFAWWSD